MKIILQNNSNMTIMKQYFWDSESDEKYARSLQPYQRILSNTI